MNDNDFDLAARAWLDDGPTRMSDRALVSTLEEIHTTRQRRRTGWPAWRTAPVRIFAGVASAAVLVVAVGLLAITVVPRLDGSMVGGPSPSPSAAGAADFPDLTTTFVSPRNGFSIMHPDSVALTPAKQLWGFSQQADDGFDVVETGLAAVFKGASTNLDLYLKGISPSGSIDERVDEYVADDHVLPGGCGMPRSQQAEITIDGQSGRISECANRTEATVVAGGRLYLFTLLSDRTDARAVFDAFTATIDLTPETAVDYPGLTTTFVSPTNGFSFGYLDRGGLEPAKEPWDPVTQPFPDDSGVRDDPFDVVETGLGAVFKGASAVIPDGVSIDAWVDEYTEPGGCGVPRSQQVEITIDGQSGRSSECANRIEATVLAGGRLYLFMLLHDRTDARAFFDAFAATIDLLPEDAAQVP